MKPKRQSLAAFAATDDIPPVAEVRPDPVPAPASNVTTLKRDDVVTSRRSRSHTTLYLPPQAIKKLREIALAYDCKPHDLLIEGVNMMLAKYGSPSVRELGEK